MTDPEQAAEISALQVWDFLTDYHHFRHNAESVTDEAMEEIRNAVFKFRREVKSSDSWQVAYGRAPAYAVLVWADDRWPANLRALERFTTVRGVAGKSAR
jgi:hypothetical protein